MTSNLRVWNHLVLPVPTFFTRDYVVDWDAQRAYISLLNSSPVQQIILTGSTGEGVSLSHSEKVKLYNLFDSELRYNISIAACPSSFIIHEIEELAAIRRIESLLILPSVYYEPEDPRLKRFIALISQRTKKPLYLYHYPKNTRFSFTPEDIREYQRAGANCVGIKLSHEPLDILKHYVSELPDIAVWHGSDRDINQAILCGSSRVVSQSLSFRFLRLHTQSPLEEVQHLCNETRQVTSVVDPARKIATLKGLLKKDSSYNFPTYCRYPLLSETEFAL
jgi:4-hydroxy-tetrahydrodipicolinate synthase